MRDDELRTFAALGVKAEIERLTALLDTLYAKPQDNGDGPALETLGTARKPMSAAQRAAVSKRMKAAWRRRKAAKAGDSKGRAK
jgi:hypothetical protein